MPLPGNGEKEKTEKRDWSKVTTFILRKTPERALSQARELRNTMVQPVQPWIAFESEIFLVFEQKSVPHKAVASITAMRFVLRQPYRPITVLPTHPATLLR